MSLRNTLFSLTAASMALLTSCSNDDNLAVYDAFDKGDGLFTPVETKKEMNALIEDGRRHILINVMDSSIIFVEDGHVEDNLTYDDMRGFDKHMLQRAIDQNKLQPK